MVSERMDESLVLLAELLSWPLEWVTHLDINVRKPEVKAEAGQQLNTEERHLLTDFLSLDVQIYNHFKRRFEEHLLRFKADYKQRMSKQLRLLKEANKKVKNECIIQHVGNEELMGKFRDAFSNNIMGYVINQ